VIMPPPFGLPIAIAAAAPERLADWLLRTSWQAAVLVLLVGAVHLLAGRRLAPRWRFALWGLVVVRLVLPVIPPSPWSVFNLSWPGAAAGDPAPALSSTAAAAAGRPLPDAAVDATPGVRVFVVPDHRPPSAAGLSPVAGASKAPAAPAPPGFDWRRALTLAWGIVAAAVAGRVALGALALRRRLRRAAPPGDDVLALLDRCRADMGVRARVPALVTDAVAGPALFGFLRPRLLLPPGLLRELSAGELRFVLLHELAHVKRRDPLTNAALLAAGALHWFNPLARLAIARCRAERELACDEMVMDATAPAARAGYGRAVLRVAESLLPLAAPRRRAGGPAAVAAAAAAATAVAGAAWAAVLSGAPAVGMIQARSQLRRRIAMISTFPDVPRRRRQPVLPLLLVLGICSCALTDRQADSSAAPPAPPARTEAGSAAAAADPGASAPAAAATGGDGKARAEGALIGGPADPPAWQPQGNPVANAVPDAPIAGPVADPFLHDLTPEERAMQAVLERTVPEVTFDAVGLDDVLTFFRDLTGANLVVDWKALEAAHVAKDAPVSVRVRNVKLAQALRLVLDQAGGKDAALEFEVDGAVLKVTTREELAKNVMTRVYDIRDLLVHIPDFEDTPQLGVSKPLKDPGEPEAKAEKAADPDKARAEAVSHITTLVKETVDPDSWRDNGGSVGQLRELQGQLIVTQTRDNQRQLVRLLTQLRETRAVQVQVEARFISLDLAALDEGLREKLRPAADAPPADKRGSTFLTDAEVNALIKQAKARDASATVVTAPRITLFNGQRAYVVVTNDRPFVSGFTAVQTGTPGEVRWEPQHSVVTSGVVLDVAATASADRKHVALTLRPQLAVLEGMGTKPFEGDDRPGAKDLLVQVPRLSQRTLRTTVSVPDRGTVVLDGFAGSDVAGAPDEATDRDGGPATRPAENLYLLVRPTLIVAPPLVQEGFPLITK
jgi:beta-lactamase regulating signal transducer with metallopeptidase domain